MGPQERALKSGVDIVVATPGRLMDHMSSSFNGGGFGNRKSIPSIADNLSKVIANHTLKAGFYFDLAA